MRRSRTHHARNRRGIGGLCLLALAVAIAAPSAGAAGQDVVLSGPLGDPEEAVTTPPTTDEPTTVASDAGEGTGVLGTLTDAKLEGMTEPQLLALQKRLRRSWFRAQAEVQRLEAERDVTEVRVDDALEAFARRLVADVHAGDLDSLASLREIREETDATKRAELMGRMTLEDQAVAREHGRALAANEAATDAVEQARAKVASVGADLEFVRAVLRGEEPEDPDAEPSFKAEHVFATGPIPDIGYWGSVTGGGMLTGWTGLASAVLGGVGCDAPTGFSASGVSQQGEASWYGPGFHGNTTANGEVYDQNTMTAAHKSLPFGTIVRVYSTTTARCAFVRINDRGPYIEGRIIDLSHAAAQAIGMEGVAPVQIEVWARPGTVVAPIVEPDPSTWPEIAPIDEAAGDTAPAT